MITLSQLAERCTSLLEQDASLADTIVLINDEDALDHFDYVFDPTDITHTEIVNLILRTE